MLEHEANLTLARVARGSVLAVEQHAACVGNLQARDDAQKRGLSAARGAEQRDQLARRKIQAHVVQRGEAAEAFGDIANFDAHGAYSPERSSAASACCRSRPPFDEALEHERDQRQASKQGSHGEGRREIVLVVEDLDVQWHGVGQSTDVPRHDRHGTELAHGASVAEDHAVEQAPFDVGQRHAPEDLPAGGAQHAGGLFLLFALSLHERDQLARHERKSDEDRRQHDAGHSEDDLNVVLRQPGSEPTLQAEDQHIDQPGDHWRNGERKIDEGDEHGSYHGNRTWRSPMPPPRQRRVGGTAISATSSVRRMATSASGSVSAARYARRPLRKACVNTAASGASRNRARKASAHRSAAIAPAQARR